ncbi:MAG: glycosyltransferase family 4 protein [Patescibacteria group bacterium]
MKILRITSIGFEGGGSDNGIILVDKVLRRMGHTVKILTSNLRSDLPHFSDFEFKALDYQPHVLKLFYRSFYPNSYFALRKVLKEYQPDIVQLHTMSQVSPSVLFLLKKYPTVMTIHGAEDFTPSLLLWSFPKTCFKDDQYKLSGLNFSGWLHYVYHRYINGAIYRFGFRNVDLFIVFSQYMKNLMKVDHIESVCVPNATKLFEYEPIDLQSNLIAYVGRIEKFKGVQYLIESMPNIIKRYSDIRLDIAGTGPYENQLKLLTKELGIESHVNFLGHLNRGQLHDLYRRLKILIVPSVWPEPFGKVGIEAMSLGRPVIASDAGGMSEWLVDGETGYLVPPENSSAIADKVIRILSTPGMLQEMSLNARSRALDFDIEQHAQIIVKLYNDVAEKNKQ